MSTDNLTLAETARNYKALKEQQFINFLWKSFLTVIGLLIGIAAMLFVSLFASFGFMYLILIPIIVFSIIWFALFFVNTLEAKNMYDVMVSAIHETEQLISEEENLP